MSPNFRFFCSFCTIRIWTKVSNSIRSVLKNLRKKRALRGTLHAKIQADSFEKSLNWKTRFLFSENFSEIFGLPGFGR